MLNKARQFVSSFMGGTAILKSESYQRNRASRRNLEEDGDDSGTSNNARQPSSGTFSSKRLASGDDENTSITYPYTRPTFLFLSPDQMEQAKDHSVRPVVVPDDLQKIPLRAGYAEVINAGKSELNEDQAVAVRCVISRHSNAHATNINIASVNKTDETISDESLDEEQMIVEELKNKIEFTYFGIFDGHGGYGAAVMASQNLHICLMKHLTKILDLDLLSNKCNSLYHTINTDDLIIGALESSFFEMDDLIFEERHSCPNTGGCTALVSVLLQDKLYVAQAGDSRAVVIRKDEIICLSKEFTPETERERILQVALANPNLLHNEFCSSQFARNVWKKDLGKQILCRTGYMKGWSPKVITTDDVKPPLISGDGKKACLMGTIRVSRGFGDHDLCVMSSSVQLKPFLSCVPEVQVYDLSQQDLSSTDILLMGSDGFWDCMTNEESADYIHKRMEELKDTDDKWVILAKELVLKARGDTSPEYAWKRNSKQLGSYDDITVFVIPLGLYLKEKKDSTKVWTN